MMIAVRYLLVKHNKRIETDSPIVTVLASAIAAGKDARQ
jgi:hypothetical protein